MASLFDVSAEAQNDLFEIWQRIESEFYDLFAALGRMSGQGHTRKELTTRPVLFFRCTPSWSSSSPT